MAIVSRLLDIQQSLATMQCRIIPTSFEADDPELSGFPIHPNWHWSSCARILSVLKPHGVMIRLPLFWQLEIPLWYACREARTPIFLNDPENMPVAAAALQRGGMDTVVTEYRDAVALVAYLSENNHPLPRAWIIVHRAYDEWTVPSILSKETVAHEVHLFPGLPMLAQCPALMNSTSETLHFHLTPECQYNESSNSVETVPRETLPAFTLQAPPITATDMCECGNITYMQTKRK